MHPFEHAAALENENKQRKAPAPKKATKQTTLPFSKRPASEEDDDDDEDDDDLKGFDFGQHKPKAHRLTIDFDEVDR